MLPEPLAPLAAWPQFVAWRLEDGRKLPYSPITGRLASSTNPADWGTYDQAAAVLGMSGVGFVFTERDPFFFLDVDKCLVGGQWSQLAQEMCARFPGAAVEVSQSGTGLHIIGSYSSLPPHRSKNTALGIELYTRERFVALTGAGAVGSVGGVHDLAPVVAQYFTGAEAGASIDWTTEPDPEWSGPDDDMQLLERALRSGDHSASAVFGTSDRLSFAHLWTADAETLAAKWPGNNGAPYDASSADQSLANQLAFWTGRDCDRMERMMRLSSLARSKWDDHPNYLENTILKAAQLVRSVYKGGGQSTPTLRALEITPADVRASKFPVRGGPAFMGFADQMQHFDGCIYVAGPHRILTGRGELLDQGRFDAMFGGFEFVLSPDGKKATTSAWEAYTKSQTFVPDRADKLCFRPEHGRGGIITESGKRLANAYVPSEPNVAEGDPSKFLNHLRKMLPVGDDLEILLSYMASVVQNPGMKAQWWPVVQGAEGNFKSFLLTIMSNAVGAHYAHAPNMKKMVKGDSNFNGWIDRKLFLGLDEVYAADRRDFFEGFKTTVTNRTIPIEGKGVEEITGDNRANGMIVTNHPDGVPITGNGRRYAAFFCAQQSPADMLRDGMTPEYIADLKDWMLGTGTYEHLGADYGIRVMGWYLHTREIEARFDPAKLSIRCPETSSTAAAMQSGLGQIEQDVLEAIGEDTPGFCGGWISSIKLDELLERRRSRIPRNKRREMLKAIGYDWHPALEANQGRVNNAVAPDGAKPRLFCKVGSIAWNNLTDAAAVGRAYSEAQLKAANEKTTAAGVFAK